ncbi:MAG: UDP-N-acetylmuramoyl-tripeptide--D-alanyl-D-alanine ligase [Lutisporaceae bacterium]
MKSEYILNMDELKNILKPCCIRQGEFNNIKNICINYFDVTQDSMFIALNSNKYSNVDGSLGFSGDEDSVFGLGGVDDGHQKLERAYEMGARFFVIDQDMQCDYLSGASVFRVNDSLEAIKQIARYYIDKIGIKVIAVTGSVGKTSCTHAIFNCLKQKFKVAIFDRVRATQLGLAYDILSKLSKEFDYLIVEMQMDGVGQIEAFCNIVNPFISVINTVSNSHVARFDGSLEQILHEKLAVYRNLRADGKIIVNVDSENVRKYFKDISDDRIVTIGTTDNVNFRATNLSTYGEYNQCKFELKIEDLLYDIKLLTIGNQSVYWALVVFSILSFLKVNTDESIKIISEFSLIPGRMQLFRGINNSLVISDSYNANSLSMSHGIEYVLSLGNKNKILILGSMLELADYTEEEHRKIGRLIYDKECKLITIGEAATYIADEAIKLGMPKNNIKVFFSFEQIVNYLQGVEISDEDVFYIKGSGKMRLELITVYLLGNKVF